MLLMKSTFMYSRECASTTDMEDKKLLNKVVIFVSFPHKKNIS